MTSLVPPAPPIPIPRSPWYALPKKIKRSAAEILDRSTTGFSRDKKRGGRPRMQNGLAAETERGEEHWERVRKRWTEGFPVRTEEQKRRDPLTIQVETTSKKRLVAYYKEVVNSSGPFRRPVRLSHLIPIIVAGWKDAGLWPSEESLREAIIEKGLNPDDYNLNVHLSSVLDSDGPAETEPNLYVTKILAKQNSASSFY